MHKYHQTNDLQCSRPCFAILHRTTCGKSDFRGELTFEDGELCWVDLCAIARATGDYLLKAILRPQLGIYPLGARPYSIALSRTSKHHSWDSDFRGQLLRQGRLYQGGIHVYTSLTGREFLKFFLCPGFSKTPGTPSALEVVKT
jgi:hypothetical protein